MIGVPRTAAVAFCLLAMAACHSGMAGLPTASVELQGHRGARGLMPENTIPAFIRALEAGADTMEMDAVITADEKVVVSHEPFFSARICSKPDGSAVTEQEEHDLNIYTMASDEVALFECGSRGNPTFPRQQRAPVAKPLLVDAIRAIEQWAKDHGRQTVKYNIEIKSRPAWDGIYHPSPERYAELLHRVVTGEGIRDRTTIQSFDPRALEAMHVRDAGQTLSYLVDNIASVATNLAQLSFSPATYSPSHRRVNSAMVLQLHEAGMRVIPWTVNDEATMRRLIDLGVDGLITDYPDLGRKVIDEAAGLNKPVRKP
ncbi:MAG: glycerophosphoryl diester phosphodiesterase [Rhodothermales bacterium]|jgi:glycerophosphoryl diester phosphodiesterase